MKLHLGCGRRYLPGWLNVDTRADVGADIVSDILDLAEIRTGEADIIYACHVLEHIPRPRLMDALKEWHRVLKPGGVLRLAVPNFAELARLYLEEAIPLWRIIGPLMGRQDYPQNTHFAVWDWDYLAWMLSEAGFHSVRPWYRPDDFPDGWDDYSRAVIDGAPISLNVEAIRG